MTCCKSLSRNDLQHVFDFLLDKVARTGGTRIGESSTPSDVAALMIKLVNPRGGMSVYDPCVGVAGFLRAAVHHAKNDKANFGRLSLYGQDKTQETLSLARIGLAINGVFDADLQLGCLGAVQH